MSLHIHINVYLSSMSRAHSKCDCIALQVGISSVWYEGNPCNMHLMDLAAEVKAGVEEAGLVGFRFNTIGVSDAISMGTDGMSFSLQSRDLIADSVETVMGAQVGSPLSEDPPSAQNPPEPFLSSAIQALHTSLITSPS